MGEYYIAHSSDPWKKHKYLKKIGEGANAIYQYAYNAAGGKEKNALNKANKRYESNVKDKSEYNKKADAEQKNLSKMRKSMSKFIKETT